MRDMVRAAFVSAMVLCCAVRAAASPLILEDDPSGLLGLDLDDVFARLGAPSSVAVVRGGEAWQADVAFVYAEGYTLLLYENRVWQIKLAKPYAGSIYGLFLGDSADKACSILGQPFETGTDYLVFRMPYKAFPVRLRLSLAEGNIVDVYIYRSDV
jgi:hypothetical protein